MAKKYVVTLSKEERDQWLALIGSGEAKARTLSHVWVILKADEGWCDSDIGKALNISFPTVERVRKQFVFEGFEASLKRRRSRRVYRRKVDGEQEAHIVAVACSAPPEGYARWSLCMLADRVVQMKITDSISHETVRHVLDENELKPWRREEWCIPTANAEFVFHMEDILDVYKRPLDPKHPLVCFDESPEQLVSETRQALPMIPGQLEKYDYEYRREGVSNMFMFFAPLQNWRYVKVTERRTKVDWANCMRDLVDIHFPHAEKIVIVQDQLNTHSPACLYEVFMPAEAKRILDRLEFHSTPKHGSWLIMAEIELSVLGRQCLNRCIPSQTLLIRATEAWALQRNNKQATVNWHFTSDDARIKLKRLYPSIDV